MGFILPKKTAKLAKKWIFLLCNEGQASPRFPVLGLLPFSHQILGQYGVHFSKKMVKLPKKMVKLPKKWIYVLFNEGQASPRFPVIGLLPFSHQIRWQYGVHFSKKMVKFPKKWMYVLCNEGQASPRFPVLGQLPFSLQIC